MKFFVSMTGDGLDCVTRCSNIGRFVIMSVNYTYVRCYNFQLDISVVSRAFITFLIARFASSLSLETFNQRVIKIRTEIRRTRNLSNPCESLKSEIYKLLIH